LRKNGGQAQKKKGAVKGKPPNKPGKKAREKGGGGLTETVIRQQGQSGKRGAISSVLHGSVGEKAKIKINETGLVTQKNRENKGPQGQKGKCREVYGSMEAENR